MTGPPLPDGEEENAMTTLIRADRIFDGSVFRREGGWVLLRDGKIEETGAGAAPAADRELGGGGMTLFPGLWNLHTHIQRRHLALPGRGGVFRQGAAYVENLSDALRMAFAIQNARRELMGGVTSIRDCGSRNRINIELKNAVSQGMVRGPRLLACGFGIACTGGHETHRYQGAVEADGPDEIRKAVRGEIRAGADFIKFMGGGGLGGMPEREDPRWIELGADELAAGVREAHNRRRRTAVHAMGAPVVETALEAGVDCIEHGAELSEHALGVMAKNGTDYVPTASGITAVAARERATGSPELAAMMEELVVLPQRDSIRWAYERGIRIGVGTDTLGDVVEELLLLRDCGLSPEACLRAATSDAAGICGLDGSCGSIRPGMAADLLLVRGDPERDLTALRQVERVFLGGEPVTAEWLVGET